MYAQCVGFGEGTTRCECFNGFEGDGQNCTGLLYPHKLNIALIHSCNTDIDECTSKPCHSNAECDNTLGSFFCTCSSGFEGDGVNSCTGKTKCLQAQS